MMRPRISDFDIVQKKNSECSFDEEKTDIELTKLNNRADKQLNTVDVFIDDGSQYAMQKSVDDLCMALQKLAIAVERNKPSPECCEKLNREVQLQFTQIVCNYMEYFKKTSPKSL